MGDVQAAARGPTGQVRLLAPHVDAAEVGAWLGAAFPEQRDHEAPPRQRARDVIAAMRDRLDEADLDVSAHVRALRYHDASVNETYTVRQVNVHGSASKGLCTLSYATGLSGGLLSGKLAVDLSDAEPVVHSDARMRTDRHRGGPAAHQPVLPGKRRQWTVLSHRADAGAAGGAAGGAVRR
jgi:hypothetical protein